MLDEPKLYAMGQNSNGTLGNSLPAKTFVFIDTGFNVPVTKIATGYDFVVLIALGYIYVAGKNGNGQVCR